MWIEWILLTMFKRHICNIFSNGVKLFNNKNYNILILSQDSRPFIKPHCDICFLWQIVKGWCFFSLWRRQLQLKYPADRKLECSFFYLFELLPYSIWCCCYVVRFYCNSNAIAFFSQVEFLEWLITSFRWMDRPMTTIDFIGTRMGIFFPLFFIWVS